MIITKTGPYLAVSYESSTFADLNFFMNTAGVTVDRIDPVDFLQLETLEDVRCINLVTKFPLRRQVSEHLDTIAANRFSVLACTVPCFENVLDGCFFYPNASIYPSAKIGQDVIIHSNTCIGHKSSIAHGCFVSALVCIAGSVTVGEHCWIGAASTIADNISLSPNTTTLIGSIVIKNIIMPNTVYRKHTA